MPTTASAYPTATDQRDRARRAATRTPAGFQSVATLARRRALMATLCLGALAAIAYGVGSLLGAGGWTPLDIGLFVCVMLSAPWTVLGFWNAVIGLWLLRGARRGMRHVAPFWRGLDIAESVRLRTAVFMTLRNEDPERAFQRLLVMRDSLDATGEGAAYDLFILSDSDQPEILESERALFERYKARLDGAGSATYRARPDNAGFKAGNVKDFLERWGDDYQLMLPLDADSVMSGPAIVRMTRVMQRHPKLGILQSLAVGAPATSPFARLFQFGMRHGMRSFTMGSAWWQGDCGPFWGHNALVRVAPFKAHCDLPVLPGRPPLGGHILSHDQVEAVLMRRAGYEVRVAPVEGESWEENPVTILDFMKREQRWLNGNMQYFPLLGMPGLRPVSRFQLVQAIMMYLAPPAWMLMTALGAFKVFEADIGSFDPVLGVFMFFAMFAMSLAPKVAGAIDVALEPGGMRRYGGPGRFGVGVAIETVFGMLMAPAVALRLTIFLIGLPFGRKIGWSGQIRDAYGLEWSTAWASLWPQVLFGAALAAAIGYGAPSILPWAAPVLLGLILAPAFAVLTASPDFGDWLARNGLAAIPDELRPSETLTALATAPALSDAPASLVPSAEAARAEARAALLDDLVDAPLTDAPKVPRAA
ncbi:MAG: glucans biosynthesis glucosyltransferase MdoH [Pseudomonadota bacterium]